METAKLFINGNSQAVRLPKDYRFSGAEVGIKKIGHVCVLFPVEKAWDIFLNGLDGFTGDFMSGGRQTQSEQARENL